MTYGKVSGDDSYSGDFFRRNRALNFNTTIAEGSGILEFTISTPEKVGNKYRFFKKTTYGKEYTIANKTKFGVGLVYLIAGIGGFYYDPSGNKQIS